MLQPLKEMRLNIIVMECGNDLERQDVAIQPRGQIKCSLAHSENGCGARSSEVTFPRFMGYKGDRGRDILSVLQEYGNVIILQ